MTVPIFPLPNVVLFPHTFLPLHVFEPRYRRLVADALEGERLVVMALAREERPAGRRPVFHPLGSVGRMEVVERRDDGRYDVVLEGLARVRIGRLEEAAGGYFSGEIEVLAETLPDLQDPRVADERAGFLLTVRRYGEQVLRGKTPPGFVNDLVPYATLVNRAADLLRVGVGEKQRLLAIDDLADRARSIEGMMDVQIEAHGAIDRFRPRRPAEPRAN